jgi:hypothetical protein
MFVYATFDKPIVSSQASGRRGYARFDAR